MLSSLTTYYNELFLKENKVKPQHKKNYKTSIKILWVDMLSVLTTYQLELFLKANRVKPQHIIYQALKKILFKIFSNHQTY